MQRTVAQSTYQVSKKLKMNYNAASMNKTRRTLATCRAAWKIDVLTYNLNALSYEEVLGMEPEFLLSAVEVEV
ncbi:MAG: hypothetical protein H9535_00920 [Ignavibacteria bacterium]|nr:hypothetical protein [Ignavibacteria bacterium]